MLITVPSSTRPDLIIDQPRALVPRAPLAGPGVRRVLVVDDDDHVHVGVRAALKPLRCGILVASSGREALEVAAANPPDLAILDIGLPDTDGYQLAYELRADLGLTAMRIIFLTGHLPNQSAVAVAGGNLFLGKPYRMQVLCDAVQQQLLAQATG